MVFLTSTEIVKDDGRRRPELRRSRACSAPSPSSSAPCSPAPSASSACGWPPAATSAPPPPPSASDFPGALQVAFRTGGSVGLATAGLGLLGATADHPDLPEHQLGDPRRLRLRRLAAGPVPAGRRRHLHQGRRRRRRPGRQGRGRHPRGRPPQPGHHRRQRGRQRRRLRRHGRRPLRELRRHPRGLDHPRRHRPSPAIGLGPDEAARGLVFPVGRHGHRPGRLDHRHLPGQGPARARRRPQAHQPGHQRRPGHLRRRRRRPGLRLRRQPRAGVATARRSPGARMFGAIVVGVALGFAASKITAYYTSTTAEAGAGHRQGRPAPARPPRCSRA